MESDISWVGTLDVPAGVPDKYKRARDLICSEWFPAFSAWLDSRIESAAPGFTPGLVVDVNWLVTYRGLFNDLSRLGKEARGDEGRRFVEMYKEADERVSAVLPDFHAGCATARHALDVSPAERLNRQGSTMTERLEFHKQSHRTAQAYTVQYRHLAAQLVGVPDEILKHVVRAKKAGLLGGAGAGEPDDGILLKKKELQLFKELVPIAKSLEELSRNQAETLKLLYRDGPETAHVWYTHAHAVQSTKNMSAQEYSALKDNLDRWYAEMRSSMSAYQAAAERLAHAYDAKLVKIAAKQTVKILGDVNPTYAGAAFALHGLAAATGVTAATVSPMIGPFSMLVTLGATGIEKAAVKVEKKGTKQALKKDDDLLDAAVLSKVKKTGAMKKLFQTAKGSAAVTHQVESAATQIEQWTQAAQVYGGMAAQAAGPVAQATDAIGLPLTGIKAVAGMAIEAYKLGGEAEFKPKFPEHVEKPVRELLKASRRHRASTVIDRKDLATSVTAAWARALYNARTGAKAHNSTSRYDDRGMIIETHLLALTSPKANPTHIETRNGSAGEEYVFDSHDVHCQEGGGGVGTYTMTGLVERIRWSCTADGKLLRIEEVKHDWRAPKSHELAYEYRLQIMSCAGYREIVRMGLANRWIMPDGDTQFVQRGNWTSDTYAPVVDDACNKWNVRQRALQDKFLSVAQEKGITPDDPGWHLDWTKVRDLVWAQAADTGTAGSGLMNVWAPKGDSVSDLLKLQVAFWNRANGNTEIECPDDFWFNC